MIGISFMTSTNTRAAAENREDRTTAKVTKDQQCHKEGCDSPAIRKAGAQKRFAAFLLALMGRSFTCIRHDPSILRRWPAIH
jgi:hypothetical protein